MTLSADLRPDSDGWSVIRFKKLFIREVYMKKLNWTKNRKIRLMTRTAAALLVFLLAAGLTGCGGSKKEEQQTVTEQPAAEEAAATEEKEPVSEAPGDQTEAEELKAEETKPEEVKPEEVTTEEVKTEEPAQQAPEKPQSAEEAKPEAGSIQKPVPTEEPKKEEKKEEKKKKASAPGLDLLDGVMTFDGMEVEFPIELSGMKLGNWKIEYQNVDDPDSKVLAPGEIVTGVMTNSAYTEDDVTAIAEFGNYSNEEVSLTDLPMTGIYLTKGKGKDGNEPKLPEVVMPGGLTWGSTEAEVRELFGEASLSGTFFDKDFDFMYENGDYMVEFGGMNDTGLEYIVYCVE